MTIAFDSVAAGARARLQVSRQLGETGARPSRVLEGHVTDCMGLADAIALSAAVVIEPSITTRPTTTATPTDVAPAQIETEVSPPVAPTVGHLDATPPSDAGPHERAPDSGDGLGFALRGAVDFDAWLAPTATFGGSVGFALRSKAWSLELGGLFLLPVATAQTLSSDRFAASVYAGTARGCARFGAIAPCVGLLAGSMVARATTVSDPIDRVLPLVALLARIEASLDLTDHIALIGGAELVIPLTKAELLIGPRAIWTSSAISLHISLGIEARFANGPL